MMKQMKDWKLKSNNMGGNLSFLYSVMQKQIYLKIGRCEHHMQRCLPHFTRRPHTKQLIYYEFPFGLHNPEKQIKKTQLNGFVEVEHLCRTLYAEVIRNFGGKNSECEESAKYRIFNKSRLSWIQKLDYYVDKSNASKLDAVDIEVARNLLNFQPDFHRKALVYGTKF